MGDAPKFSLADRPKWWLPAFFKMVGSVGGIIGLVLLLVILTYSIPTIIIQTNSLDRQIYNTTKNKIYGEFYFSELIKDKIDLSSEIEIENSNPELLKAFLVSEGYEEQKESYDLSSVYVKRTMKVLCTTDLVVLIKLSNDNRIIGVEGYRAEHIDSIC